VEGFAVPHVHVRLHPCYNRVLELNGAESSEEEQEEVVEKIKRALS